MGRHRRCGYKPHWFSASRAVINRTYWHLSPFEFWLKPNYILFRRSLSVLLNEAKR